VPGADRLFDLLDPGLQIAELIDHRPHGDPCPAKMRVSASSLMTAISSETRQIPSGATIPNSPRQPRIRYVDDVCKGSRSEDRAPLAHVR
jgi:hypothetical protein